jgi:hypothetical protein
MVQVVPPQRSALSLPARASRRHSSRGRCDKPGLVFPRSAPSATPRSPAFRHRLAALEIETPTSPCERTPRPSRLSSLRSHVTEPPRRCCLRSYHTHRLTARRGQNGSSARASARLAAICAHGRRAADQRGLDWAARLDAGRLLSSPVGAGRVPGTRRSGTSAAAEAAPRNAVHELEQLRRAERSSRASRAELRTPLGGSRAPVSTVIWLALGDVE